MPNNTKLYVTKRIIDTLCEYTDDSLFVSVSDADRDALSKRIPDAVNSALVRMYESLPLGLEKGFFEIPHPAFAAYLKELSNDGAWLEADSAEYVAAFLVGGRGSLVVTDENEEVLFEKVFCGSGKVQRGEAQITLSGRRLYVRTTGFLSVSHFTLYKNDAFDDVNAYPVRGFESICLPDDFARLEYAKINGRDIDTDAAFISGKYAHIPMLRHSASDKIFVCYRKNPPVVTEDSDDDFEFDLPPLAIEALVYLAASELCSPVDSARYSRLVYKYTDLSAGLSDTHKRSRNRFFKGSREMRWR